MAILLQTYSRRNGGLYLLCSHLASTGEWNVVPQWKGPITFVWMVDLFFQFSSTFFLILFAQTSNMALNYVITFAITEKALDYQQDYE